MSNPVLTNVLQTIFLSLTIGASFYISNNQITGNYLIQIISLLAIIYFILNFASKKIMVLKRNMLVISFFIISMVVYISVFNSGSLFSPLFFLIYFLLFGISLLFEPLQAFVLSLVLSIFFLLTPRKEFIPEIMQLTSLFLISPLAIIFGSQYKKLLQSQTRIELMKNEEKELVDEVMDQEKKVKVWTEQEFKNTLAKIWNNLDSISSDVNLPPNIKTRLYEISNQLSKLLKSAEEMEKKIEE